VFAAPPNREIRNTHRLVQIRTLGFWRVQVLPLRFDLFTLEIFNDTDTIILRLAWVSIAPKMRLARNNWVLLIFSATAYSLNFLSIFLWSA
jgi:hypothetical protein